MSPLTRTKSRLMKARTTAHSLGQRTTGTESRGPATDMCMQGRILTGYLVHVFVCACVRALGVCVGEFTPWCLYPHASLQNSPF